MSCPEVIELLDDSSDGSSSEGQPLRLLLKQKGQRQSQRVRRAPTRTGDVVRTDYLPSGDSSNSDEDYQEHVSKPQRLRNAAEKLVKSSVSAVSDFAAPKTRQTPSTDRPKRRSSPRATPTATPTFAARKEQERAKTKAPAAKPSAIPNRVRLAARKSAVRVVQDTEDEEEEEEEEEESDDFDEDQPIHFPSALKNKIKTVASAVNGRSNAVTTKHEVATHPSAARKSVTPTAKTRSEVVAKVALEPKESAKKSVRDRSSSVEKVPVKLPEESPVGNGRNESSGSLIGDAGSTLTAASLKRKCQVATKSAVSSAYVNSQEMDHPVVAVATLLNSPSRLVQTLPTVPITHSTGWRCLRFDRAPKNIISTTEPYSAEFDRPLTYYDDSGALAQKCTILASFNPEPEKKRRLDLSKKATLICSPVETKRKIRALIETEMPRIQSCHQRRISHIIQGARRDVKKHFENVRQQNGHLRTCNYCHYEHSQIEKFYGRRQQQNRPDDPEFNSLVGNIRYLLGRSDVGLGKAKYECYSDRTFYPRICCPETVIRVSNDITCLRQSKTCIGVGKSFFVPDDPILRYLPYFGKNGTVRIDPELYDATTMDQATKFLVAKPSTGGVTKNDGDLKRVPESALDDEVKEYMLRMIVAKFGGGPEVFDAVKEELGFPKPSEDYAALKKMYDGIDFARSRIAAVRSVVARTRKRKRDPKEKGAIAARSVTVGDCVALLADHCWFLRGDKHPTSLTTRLTPPIPYFESNYTRYPTCGGLRKSNEYGKVIDTYRDMFCRRCFTYDCEEHGIQHPLPLERIDPVNPVVRKSGLALRRAQNDKDAEAMHDDEGDDSDMIEILSDEEVKALSPPKSVTASVLTVDNEPRRRSKRSLTRADTLASAALQVQEAIQENQRLLHLRLMTKQQRRGIQAVDISEYLDDSYAKIVAAPVKALMVKNSSCCKTCWRSSSKLEDSTSPPPDDETKLSDVQAVLTSKLLSIFNGNACVAAAAIKSSTLSCSHIARFEKSYQSGGNAAWREPSQRTANRRKNSSSAPHSNREILRRMKNQQKDDYTPRYAPCKHDGPCDGACECVINGTRCDMACACSRGCSNRFQGCKCSMANCRTNACPCFSVGRECDPDFCFSCGASEAAVMAFDPDRKRAHSHELGICANVNLLRGTHRKVGIAFSSTHGWGAFALEPIPKGEYVMEYTGSLISDEEAERRGVIYDRISSSFLFKINSDETVDAARKGNKSKFANHKPEGKGNCEAKIRVVRGEHRIALFAKDNIAVGEEIFYDYGHKGDTAPDWHQKILRSTTP